MTTLLAADACDRATAYHMSNKVVRHPDGLFVTWLDQHYRAILAQLNPETGQVLMSFPLHQGCDNHCRNDGQKSGDQASHYRRQPQA